MAAPRCSQTAWMSASSDTFFLALRQWKATSLHLRGAGRNSSCWLEVHIGIKQQADPLHLLRLGILEMAMTTPLATFEDSTLIQLALAGQSECFSVLMDRHSAAVRRRIGSMVRNTTDVEDLLQEVLLKVWRHLSTFRSESSFRTWMIRVAVNEVLQLYRREQRWRWSQTSGDPDALSSPCESPHQSLARGEVTHAVRTAVAGLPAKYRQVLILRDLDQLSVRETAQWLQSSIPAVKTRLFRARHMLLAALQGSRVTGSASPSYREARDIHSVENRNVFGRPCRDCPA